MRHSQLDPKPSILPSLKLRMTRQHQVLFQLLEITTVYKLFFQQPLSNRWHFVFLNITCLSQQQMALSSRHILYIALVDGLPLEDDFGVKGWDHDQCYWLPIPEKVTNLNYYNLQLQVQYNLQKERS